MTRKILHIDLDAFFCSVEELKDPSLHGKAFAVGGGADQRGVISTCSYAARMFGVHSAMPTGQALKLCPQLILLRGHHAEYEIYSRQVMDILRDISPLVEVVSIDEAFVDVSDLPQSLELLARQIQQRILAQTKLPVSIGGATSKLVAKIATDAGKSKQRTAESPRAITIVLPGTEMDFLAPLSVQAIWGIGPKAAARFNSEGVYTIGDLQKLTLQTLKGMVGNTAQSLYDSARGIDPTPVRVEHGMKSISQETTFEKDIFDITELQDVLKYLTRKTVKRLRENQYCADTVRIKVRLHDFATYTRQVRLKVPTDVESVILHHATELLNLFHKPGQAVRLLGIGVSGLQESWHQMGLWEENTEKEIRLHAALDELQDKYGRQAIQRGKVKNHG